MPTNFPVSLDTYTVKSNDVDYYDASHVNNLQDAIRALEAKVGVDESDAEESFDYRLAAVESLVSFFESGRKLWLYENVAPTGWTIENVTDRVLAVKGGNRAYNVPGGSSQNVGTWTQPGHLHSETRHKHVSANHHHRWYLNPDRTYAENGAPLGLSVARVQGAAGIILSPGQTTYGVIGSICYTDYVSGQDTTLNDATNTTENTTANSWRPAAAVGIIVVKE